MADTGAETPQTPFQRIGGADAVRALVMRFYDVMDGDPAFARLRSIHGDDLAPMRASLTGFLSGWMGGPRDWFGSGKCVMSAHTPFVIDANLRDQWLAAMRIALDEAVPDADLRALLDGGFERVADRMVRV
ncbi:MAG: group II truncated hemoglobin [Pseudomonadota bacterium]